jgi:alpha-beta hydrolase superfamily lysophospholipase
MISILFSSQTPVKPSRPFGKGLLAFSPHFHVSSHTASDAAWLAADNARRARATQQPEVAPDFPTDAEFDEMALWATGCDDAGNNYASY